MTSFQKVLASLLTFLNLSAGREKLCRLLQYFSKYLSSSYLELSEIQPHLRNQLFPKIKKADTLSGSMGMARKVLRFGPSIVQLKTFITNVMTLIKAQHKESTPIFILRTLSALWLAGYFICDHYLWLFKMGITKDKNLQAKMQYLSIVSWYLDCWTGLLKNILIYSQLSESEKKKQKVTIAADTARVIIDLPVAYSFLYPGSVPGKTVGILGSITSLLGIFLLWK